jgi:hypothetical protein
MYAIKYKNKVGYSFREYNVCPESHKVSDRVDVWALEDKKEADDIVKKLNLEFEYYIEGEDEFYSEGVCDE